MPDRRVVITGIGPITAFGLGIDPLWSALEAGATALRTIDIFESAGFAMPVAAQLDEFKVRDVVPKSYRKSIKVMCRDIELAVGAAAAAIADAGLVTRGTDPDASPTIDPARFGCHIGAGLISADIDELAQALITSGKSGTFDLGHWGAEGLENLTPLWLLKYLPNMLACHVTIVHDCRGPSNTITCCEASSALSLGESMRTIERGAADACLTGGAESKLNLLAYLRQEFAGRLVESGASAEAVAPFAPNASGTALGEGGGLLVIEHDETAAARGATPYATIAGYAATQSLAVDERLHAAADPTAMGDAMEDALADARIDAGSIDAIVPFGSGIPELDAAEREAITRIFGDGAASIPLITTIPAVGNCNAGNGAIGLCVAARCLREQRLPARLHTAGAEGLDANAADARPASLGNVLVFTTSQGGQNAAVVLQGPNAA